MLNPIDKWYRLQPRTRFGVKAAASFAAGYYVGGLTIFGAAWAGLGLWIANKQLTAEEDAQIARALSKIMVNNPEWVKGLVQ